LKGLIFSTKMGVALTKFVPIQFTFKRRLLEAFLLERHLCSIARFRFLLPNENA